MAPHLTIAHIHKGPTVHLSLFGLIGPLWYGQTLSRRFDPFECKITLLNVSSSFAVKKSNKTSIINLFTAAGSI